MDKKQKEALIIALAEKGETYRDITKKAGVSPNTIKVVLNRVLTNLLLYSLESSNSFQKGRLLYK
jgi:lambda repressor-like predicted transcriptional regulator